jgi:hypothetical protein
MKAKTKILHKKGSKFQLFLFAQTRCSMIIIWMPEDSICGLHTIVNGAGDLIMDIGDAIIIDKG